VDSGGHDRGLHVSLRRLARTCGRHPSRLARYWAGDVAGERGGGLGPVDAGSLPHFASGSGPRYPEYVSKRVGTGGAEVTYACCRGDGLSELRHTRGGSDSPARAVRDALCLRGHPPGRTHRAAFTAQRIGIVGSARAQRPGTGRRRDADPVNGLGPRPGTRTVWSAGAVVCGHVGARDRLWDFEEARGSRGAAGVGDVTSVSPVETVASHGKRQRQCSEIA
jgi:hypothetical protein